jgi:beta-alanine--pyruvate transaminase
LFDRAAEMSPYFLECLFALKDMKQITDIRGYGMLGGIDLAPAERPGQRGTEAQKKLFNAGMHIKFTGDSGIVAPALVAEKKHIDEMCKVLRAVISTF